MTVADLCNHFLTAKEKLVESGRLTRGSWNEYLAASKLMGAVFEKHRLVKRLLFSHFDDLHLTISRAYGLHRTATLVQRVRLQVGRGERARRPNRFWFQFQEATKTRIPDSQGPEKSVR